MRFQDQVPLAVFFAVMFVPLFLLTQVGKERKTTERFRYQVDLNTAEAAELQTLPGIGEKLADGIIRYRNDNGGFKQPSELKNIKGIGVKKHAAAEPFIAPIHRE